MTGLTERAQQDFKETDRELLPTVNMRMEQVRVFEEGRLRV